MAIFIFVCVCVCVGGWGLPIEKKPNECGYNQSKHGGFLRKEVYRVKVLVCHETRFVFIRGI